MTKTKIPTLNNADINQPQRSAQLLRVITVPEVERIGGQVLDVISRRARQNPDERDAEDDVSGIYNTVLGVSGRLKAVTFHSDAGVTCCVDFDRHESCDRVFFHVDRFGNISGFQMDEGAGSPEDLDGEIEITEAE
jgi:hypothetical protein